VPPTSGSIIAIEVTNPGSGYTSPTVVITPPDSPNGALPYPAGAQAVANAQTIGGMISNVSVSFGGAGYFQPQVTITDPHGTGAIAVPQLSPISVLQFQQEVYNFADFPLDTFAGVQSVFAVIDVSVIYANYRYVLPYYPLSIYQAYIRQYPRQYLYVPTMHTQLGQGTGGSLLMYPIPSQQYQWEADCICLPEDLVSDNEPEALPAPWTDAVPYMAASLAYAELQNFNASKYYQDQYDNFVHRYSAYARPGRTINPYGRW
jgi:hypothetical protein